MGGEIPDLISANGAGGGVEYEASSEVQKKIVNKRIVISPFSGCRLVCQWEFYRSSKCRSWIYWRKWACDMYRNYTFTVLIKNSSGNAVAVAAVVEAQQDLPMVM